MLNLVHSLICVRIFQTFDCVSFDQGREGNLTVLRVDFGTSCDSEKHNSYIIYAYFCIVVYVVVVPVLSDFGCGLTVTVDVILIALIMLVSHGTTEFHLANSFFQQLE